MPNFSHNKLALLSLRLPITETISLQHMKKQQTKILFIKFQDGDTVIIEGICERDGVRVGFGDVRGHILPAHSL